jgi:hypothetical protein
LTPADFLEAFFFDPFCFFPQLVLIAVSKSFNLPFWPPILIDALFVALQRLVLFCRRPFFPPASLSSNLETGASGTAAKVVLTLEVSEPFLLTESMNPTRLMWI